MEEAGIDAKVVPCTTGRVPPAGQAAGIFGAGQPEAEGDGGGLDAQVGRGACCMDEAVSGKGGERMKTYLVTGGAGFIGSNFVHYLLKKHQDILVVNVDKLTCAGNLENLDEVMDDRRHVFVQADICNKDAMGKLFEQYNIDYVVNFAAESHVDRSIKDPEVFVRTNVLGTMTLLDCARKAWLAADGSFRNGAKYLQVSTDEVYGALGAEGYFTEGTPLDPHSPYSASKAGANLLVKS